MGCPQAAGIPPSWRYRPKRSIGNFTYHDVYAVFKVHGYQCELLLIYQYKKAAISRVCSEIFQSFFQARQTALDNTPYDITTSRLDFSVWKRMKNLAINLQPLIYGAFPVCRNYTVRAHIRDLIAEKRRGCADAVGNARPLQRGVHAQHLRPLDAGHETERGRRDWKHHPQRDLTPKPKRRLQVAAAVQTFKIFLKTEKLVLFCQINLDKSTAFSRDMGLWLACCR